MSDKNITKFRDVLARNGYHVTNQRIVVFRLLDHEQPQSMRAILNKANGQIDRVSVYRSIELFEKLSIVKRIYIGWKYKLELTDEFLSHHHHLSCLRCGKVIDIEDERHIAEFITQTAAAFGFTPLRHQFEIEGYCSDCRIDTAT